MIMNKIILVPRARVRCLVLCLAALVLLALQIPVRVFAATTQDGKGEDRVAQRRRSRWRSTLARSVREGLRRGADASPRAS